MSSESGNADATYNYAKFLLKDNKVGNEDTIINEHTKAAEAGNTGSMLELYCLIKDKEESIQWLRKAVNIGHILAIKVYASKIARNEIKGKKESDAIYLYKKSMNGDILMMKLYANEVRRVCKYESFCCYRICADFGDTESMIKYAKMVYYGECFPPDKREASRFIKRAADKGNIDAMCMYAQILYEGDGIEVDYTKSIEYYKMSMSRDCFPTEAWAGLALAYYEGHGFTEDRAYAAQLFRQAADKNHVLSMVRYADMLFSRGYIKTNKEEAFKYYKMAAEFNNSEAMLKLGNMNFKGDGVDVDENNAIEYYKKAADFGNSEAMLKYARVVQEGNGIDVKKDLVAKYYKKASDLGNSEAMIKYASMLYKGDGISENKELANEYCKKAVEIGDSKKKKKIIYASMLENRNINSVDFNIDLSNMNNPAAFDKRLAAKLDLSNVTVSDNSGTILKFAYIFDNDDDADVNKDLAAKYSKNAADLGNSEAMLKYASMLYKGESISLF